MAEEVVGIIPHIVEPTGRIQTQQNTIVVTNQRLVVAQFTAQMMQEALAQSKARGGKGLLGSLLAGRVLDPSDVVNYTDKYWSTEPDSIVSESPGNFSLELGGITTVRVDHEVRGPSDEDSHIGFDRYLLVIDSIQGQYSYVFDADPQDIAALRSVLGDRLIGSARPRPVKPVSSHSPSLVGRGKVVQTVDRRFCTNCGKQIAFGANFCQHCGKEIR
jgi:hypothetical protein